MNCFRYFRQENMPLKRQRILYCVIIFLIGCSASDMITRDNPYLEKTPYPDPSAAYIGEWTAGMTGALTSICITASGRVRICSSNSYFGSKDGFIYQEQGKTFMIFESGDTYELTLVTEDYILARHYDKDYKFYTGRVPQNCRSTFNQFRLGKEQQ